MVKERMDLLELLRKGGMDGDVDFLREALRVLVEGIMDAEVSSRIGAEYGERSPERVTQRNGYRSRAWDTRVGTMDLHIPKLREGSYFPSLLEPRRRSERALLAVIQQAYVEGVSTRRVDDLVKALCQRQLNSEHFRQSKIDPITVDGCFAKLELTHLLVIAQRQCQQLSSPLFRQWSGLWELSLALREDTAGRGTVPLAASP